MSRARVVDTPDKAAAYCRGLSRDAARMEKIVGELPGYFNDLPEHGRAEILMRLGNLRDRIADVLDSRPSAR